jgi:hypothetical protein
VVALDGVPQPEPVQGDRAGTSSAILRDPMEGSADLDCRHVRAARSSTKTNEMFTVESLASLRGLAADTVETKEPKDQTRRVREDHLASPTLDESEARLRFPRRSGRDGPHLVSEFTTEEESPVTSRWRGLPTADYAPYVSYDPASRHLIFHTAGHITGSVLAVGGGWTASRP